MEWPEMLMINVLEEKREWRGVVIIFVWWENLRRNRREVELDFSRK